jgi:EAL domain-containing protein (putative c-di-GMP-specific phosphodiesterase class I)
MEDDEGDEAIIRAVVNLGKNLGIKVVAEGIENMRQAKRLIELGCDYGQGFLFSRAVPASAVPALLVPEEGSTSRHLAPALVRRRPRLVASRG